MRMMPSIRRYLILIAIAISLQTGVITQTFAQAQLCTPFDNFSNTTQLNVPILLTNPAPGPLNILDNGAPGVIGTFRDIEFGPLAGGVSATSILAISAGTFALNGGTDGIAPVSILYDANGAGLNLDLSTAISLALTLTVSDLNGTSVNMIISDSTNSTSLEIMNIPNIQDGATFPTNIDFPLAQFTGIGAVDFTDVQSIEVQITPTQDSVDVTISTADICNPYQPPQPVPTLSNWVITSMVVLFGLMGLMMVRRKRTAAKF